MDDEDWENFDAEWDKADKKENDEFKQMKKEILGK